MKEVRLDVPDNFINDIKYKIKEINGNNINLQQLSSNDITREALAVYNWVLEQVHNGYAVVSVNKNRDLISQIETPYVPARVPTK